MKSILFFDINKDSDKILLDFKLPDYNFYFFESSIENTDMDTIDLDSVEIISIFITSKVKKEILEKFKNLKAIMVRSVGFSHIDLDYCKIKDIKVFNTPHYGDNTVAEFTFASLLFLIRKLNNASLYMKTCDNNNQNNFFKGIELHNKTIGIVGVGAIGQKVAQISNGFSMNILGYDIKPKKQLEYTLKIKYTDFETLCRNSDIISVNSPLTKDNYHLFNKDVFRIMKDGVIFINTSRGELVNTLDLYNSILEGKIAYCGLDVLECEEIICNKGHNKNIECFDYDCLKNSFINNRLINLKSVLVTPHIAYDTKEAVIRINNITIENILNYIKKDYKNQIKS